MSAAKALHAAQAAGIRVSLDGDGLVLEADAEPPQSILDALARHKRAILGLLQPRQCGRIAATNGGQAHSKAASSALESHVIEWLNQHPAPSAPGHCTWCGRADSPSAVVLPFGTEPGTHTWLHAECWPAWQETRKAHAMAALVAAGISAASSESNLPSSGK
jgi:hypothetical protein